MTHSLVTGHGLHTGVHVLLPSGEKLPAPVLGPVCVCAIAILNEAPGVCGYV